MPLDNEIKVSSSITQEMLNHFIEYEGKVNHFYLDGAGFVTIGIGCVIPDANAATKLSLLNKLTNLNTTPYERMREYGQVKKAPQGQSLSYYNKHTILYIMDVDIIKLFEFRILNLLAMLKSQVPEYAELPKAAKNVLLDMAFNLGVTGLMTKFPRFLNAMRNSKWQVALKECERNSIQSSRNEWTKNQLSSLLEI